MVLIEKLIGLFTLNIPADPIVPELKAVKAIIIDQ